MLPSQPHLRAPAAVSAAAAVATGSAARFPRTHSCLPLSLSLSLSYFRCLRHIRSMRVIDGVVTACRRPAMTRSRPRSHLHACTTETIANHRAVDHPATFRGQLEMVTRNRQGHRNVRRRGQLPPGAGRDVRRQARVMPRLLCIYTTEKKRTRI